MPRVPPVTIATRAMFRSFTSHPDLKHKGGTFARPGFFFLAVTRNAFPPAAREASARRRQPVFTPAGTRVHLLRPWAWWPAAAGLHGARSPPLERNLCPAG